MAQTLRSSNLFVAEDWTVVYTAFQQVNFAAYDFDSIRTALIEYIRINFPEDFNDWIESSEFVAIIDLLAYVGQSLSFRMDLNTRENFLDTAESRDSILRIARMLSYNPRRNFPAFGLTKVDSVQTTEPLIDSENRNLSGITVEWNSATNTDWLEQFLLISNAAFNVNNPFGTPTKSGTVTGIPTDIYEFNNVRGVNVVFPFKATIAGLAVPFEIVNSDFEDGGTFSELEPDPYQAFNIIYRNDGTGNGSINTGFFLPMKQGTLKFEDLELSVPIENRLIDFTVKNINQTDTWFQEINESGQIIDKWTQVPTVAPSSNVIYNAIEKLERNIFTVISQEDDKVSYRFADGRFGNIPQGVFRSWYRESNGLSYQVKPQDVQNLNLTIPYQNAIGQSYVLTITFSLQTTITNATTAETLDDIKTRAPQVYYTQDRMVNGEDYNIFPLTRTSQALKVNATNRTYSGHSRYVNINDPTGTIQNTNVFADDGLFYKDYDTSITELSRSSNTTNQQIINNHILPAIQGTALRNFVIADGTISTNFDLSGSQRLFWKTVTEISNGSTGYFEQNSTIRLVGDDQLDPYYYIKQDALINLVLATDTDADGIWIKVDQLIDNGNGVQANGTGTVTINERLDDLLWIVKQVVPVFSTVFSDSELIQIEDQLQLKNTFGLGYNYELSSWYIIESQDLAGVDSTYDLTFAEDKSGTNLDASWLIRIEYTSASWKFYTRGLNYIWESVTDVRFFYSKSYTTVNVANGKPVTDTIKILKINSQPDSTDALTNDLTMQLDDSFIYPDGYIEPRRVKVTMLDSDQDGVPDDPQIFEKVVAEGTYIFWQKVRSIDSYEYLAPIVIDESNWRTTVPVLGDPVNPVDKDLVFVFDAGDDTVGSFYEYDGPLTVWNNVTDDYEFNAHGRSDLIFQWKHFIDRRDRVDPSISNIIDIFVLTSDYDTELRNWIKVSNDVLTKPAPPTSDELRLLFADLDDFKMISDQIIWSPAIYKNIFGTSAEDHLQASFKVIKNPNTRISDNEIKSQIITAIDEYFAIANWSFGDTFFYTELSTYIHQQMAALISSIVIVPNNTEASFGNLFQIKSEPNELFISGATVSDIQIVDNLTVSNLRIGN